MQLLRKFYKYDIIKRVDGKENFQTEFHDNNDLYRLSQAALDKLPVVQPNEEENFIPSNHSIHTQNSMVPNTGSLANESVMSNSLATVKTLRTVPRTFSNASSLRPCELPQLSCCVNSAFNTSLSDERSPLRSIQPKSLLPQINFKQCNVNKRLYEAKAASRIQTPVNVFWL